MKSFDFSIYDWCIGPHEDFSLNYGQFRQSVGPTTVLPRAATALDFFKLLFSMNIVNRIVVQTNKYAQQQYEAAGKDFESFHLVTKEEFMSFIRIFIAMGIHQPPSIRDYWSTDWVLGVPSLVRCMPRHHFEKIFQYLHLNDNTNMVLNEVQALTSFSRCAHLLTPFVQNFCMIIPQVKINQLMKQ